MTKHIWTTETRRLSDLLPRPDNPRQLTDAQAEHLRISLRKFGYSQLIEINPDNMILDGHQRDMLMRMMAEFGPDYELEVRVVEPPMTNREWQEYTTRRHEGAVGDWDFDGLANWDGVDVGDLVDWGFDPVSLGLEDWGKEEPPADPGAQIDKAAELQEKWGTALGQLWEVGRHRIVCGDCTDAAVVEKLMQGEKAALGVTSPPYFVGKEYEVDTSFVEQLALLRGVADRALDAITPGGFFFVNFGEIAAQSHTKPLTGSDRQCLYLISKDYWQIFHVERDMDLYAMRVWYKPFNRLQQPFWTYHTSIPHHQEWEHLWTWRLPGGDGDECYDWDISSRAVWDTRTEATDDKPLTRHVAAFPVGIPGRAIKAHSPVGSIVWEPFLGSGTTLVVCEQLARIGHGIEIEPKYVAVALERLAGMGMEPKLVGTI